MIDTAVKRRQRESFNLFVLTLFSGASIIGSGWIIRFLFSSLWRSFQIAESLSEAMIASSASFILGLSILNLTFTCLAWRWEGEGKGRKGMKCLAILLGVEMVVLVIFPAILLAVIA